MERSNKETMRHARDIAFDRRMKKRWSSTLSLVMRIFNSNMISSIGVSPAQILFGNAISLDRGIFYHSENDHIQEFQRNYRRASLK